MSLTKLQSQSVDTNITVAGVVTATAFYGDGSNLTGIGSASTALTATYADTSGIATYATSSGLSTYADTSGISTYATSSGIATYADTSGIATDVVGGIASVIQLSVSGVSTLGTLEVSSGIVTATSGIITYYGDGSQLSNVISGIGIGTTGGVVGYGVTFIDLKGAGVSTTFYDSNVGIATIFFEGGGGGSAAIGIGTEFPASPANGDLFYHIDYARTFVYYDEVTLGIGSTAVWVDSAPFNEGGGLVAAKSETSFTATAGQTTFTTPYSVGFIDVYLNGVRLSPTEFTATDGTSVVLSVGASLNDVIDIVEYTMGKGDKGDIGDNKWITTTAGIHTLSNVGIGTTNPRFALEVGAVGASGTSLYVNGDARVTGILTVGTSSITLDGINNEIKIGTAITFSENGTTSFLNNPVLVGTGTSTGTADQTLQVTGGAYVSGNLGIGTTTSSTAVSVAGTIAELTDGTYWNVVTQADVGIGASQVPLNQYLGKVAYLDKVGTIGVSSAAPVNNLEVNFEFVSNTSIRVRMRGTDGVVRSSTLTLS